MYTIESFADCETICQILNQAYHKNIARLALHREMIGFVYFAESATEKYVLKIYRQMETENALCSIPLIQYLRGQAYPVVSIVPTTCDEFHITLNTPQGSSIAILYDFIEGTEPSLEREICAIGRQVGWLHRIMQNYSGPLIRRGRDFYIDRYLDLLRKWQYPPDRIAALETYGHELWSRLENLPVGFCHGDLHTGNMIQTPDNQLVLFDFDVASRTHSVIDVATICDASDFNNFNKAAYEQTLRVFERFYQGYSQEKGLTDAEIRAIFDFIPIRHFELIATIVHCQELPVLSNAFLDEQYEWALQWKDVCERVGNPFWSISKYLPDGPSTSESDQIM